MCAARSVNALRPERRTHPFEHRRILLPADGRVGVREVGQALPLPLELLLCRNQPRLQGLELLLEGLSPLN